MPKGNSVSSLFLIQGAVYAMEQAGILLTEAVMLFKKDKSPTALVLAAFAKEEIGRSRILLKMQKDVADGKSLTMEEVKNKCEDHVIKQSSGQLSAIMKFSGVVDELWKLGQVMLGAKTETTEWHKANDQISNIAKIRLKKMPKFRHIKRLQALYVEPSEEPCVPPLHSAAAALRGLNAGHLHPRYSRSNSFN